MDPNKILKEILELAKIINDDESAEANGWELAQLIIALDKWLSEDGFKPERWSK